VVTYQQVRLLIPVEQGSTGQVKLSKTEKTSSLGAAKEGMDEKTARKYHQLGRLPSEVRIERTWRSREDLFAEVWVEVEGKLANNPGLLAKTLFEDLQRRYPGQFTAGQLRTLQRRARSAASPSHPFVLFVVRKLCRSATDTLRIL